MYSPPIPQASARLFHAATPAGSSPAVSARGRCCACGVCWGAVSLVSICVLTASRLDCDVHGGARFASVAQACGQLTTKFGGGTAVVLYPCDPVDAASNFTYTVETHACRVFHTFRVIAANWRVSTACIAIGRGPYATDHDSAEEYGPRKNKSGVRQGLSPGYRNALAPQHFEGTLISLPTPCGCICSLLGRTRPSCVN